LTPADDSSILLTQRKRKEQGSRPSVHQASTNLHIKSSADGTSNSDELDVPTFERSVGFIADIFGRTDDTGTALLERRLFFVDSDPVLGRSLVDVA
jgi:hypothetical protein